MRLIDADALVEDFREEMVDPAAINLTTSAPTIKCGTCKHWKEYPYRWITVPNHDCEIEALSEDLVKSGDHGCDQWQASDE